MLPPRFFISLLLLVLGGILVTPLESWSGQRDFSTGSSSMDRGPQKTETAEVDHQEKDTVQGIPWQGEPGVIETVDGIMARERQSERSQGATPRELEPFFKTPRNHLEQNPLSPAVSSWPALPGFEIPTSLGVAYQAQVVGANFLGAQYSEASGDVPPDSMGAVGPSQFLVCVNGRVKVFDKKGALGSLNASTDVFFASVRGTALTTDPRVRFDRFSGRWFVQMITLDLPNKILIAVSSGGTITSISSFSFFRFQQDQVFPAGDTGAFADYDTLGIDSNALYIGVNVRSDNTSSSQFLSTTGFVVRKSSLLSGGPIFVTAFRKLATATDRGPYSPQGVDNDDPLATEGYFIGVDTTTLGLLQLLRVSDPGGLPSISSNIYHCSDYGNTCSCSRQWQSAST